MTEKETVKIITFLANNYTEIKNRTKEEKQTMIKVWHECLKDLDYEIVLEAIKKTIMKSKFIPTIAEIREYATEIINPTEQQAPVELWNRAWKLIGRASRVTDEEFSQEPIEIQRFFGSIYMLRDYGMQEDLNIDVLRSNFISQCNLIQANEKEKKLIPTEMRDRLSELTQKFLN